MADSTIRTRLLARMRGHAALYRLLAWIKRAAIGAWISLWRILGAGVCVGAPRGFYSGTKLIDSGLVRGRVVVRGQQMPPLPSPSLIVSAGMNQNGRQPWPVFWMKQEEARLVGPSLAPMDTNKNLMIEAVYGEEFCRHDPSFNYTFLPPPVRLEGPWTSLFGAWSEGFYHWLTDALPRLALLSEFPAETKILIHGPLKRYQKECLSMMGLLDRVRETPEQHLLVEDYYFSSPVCMTGCTSPRSVLWLREQFIPHASRGATPERFFVRREGKTRGIANQEEISVYLESLGWGVVDLEQLSFSEQIAYFSNAEAIIAEHGAGLTNLLWCSSGCRVLELCPDNFLNGCYEGIASCNGLKHEFRIFPANGEFAFTVDQVILSKWISG